MVPDVEIEFCTYVASKKGGTWNFKLQRLIKVVGFGQGQLWVSSGALPHSKESSEFIVARFFFSSRFESSYDIENLEAAYRLEGIKSWIFEFYTVTQRATFNYINDLQVKLDTSDARKSAIEFFRVVPLDLQSPSTRLHHKYRR